MKKILIVSYLFAPENKIGAIRPTKLAKYISEGNEYEVKVITTSHKSNYDKSLIKDISCNIKINELNHSKYIQRYISYSNKRNNNKLKNNPKVENSKIGKEAIIEIEVSKKSIITKILKNLKPFIRILISIIIAYDFLYAFKSHVKKNKIIYEDYDVLITTFGPIASILCGLYFKKKNPQINWICDFRDPMVVELRHPLENYLYSKIQKKSCEISNSIIAVSKGYLQRICGTKYKEKSFVIPNGFDDMDSIETKKDGTDSGFSFTYTGNLYGGKRKLNPLFETLSLLINEEVILQNDITINYAGNDFESIQKQATLFGLNRSLVNYGYLSRDSSLDLQKNSRFLILSTWNGVKEKGVFPGKFLEYMLMRKPIISIVDGEIPNSEVTEVMKKLNLGISYENARSEKDFFALKKYINKEYLRYKNGLEPDFFPNNELVGNYNYKNISKQFEELF